MMALPTVLRSLKHFFQARRSLAVIVMTAIGLLKPILELKAAAISQTNLPNIRQIAVLPVYWQGQFPQSDRLKQSKKHIEAMFPKIVRDSKRFICSDDVLSSELWSTAEGRRQLVEEYEIDGLLNLTVSIEADLMLWTVRLLKPSMQNYLTETERVPLAWLLAATPAEQSQRLQNLLFRMLNRYPIDVYVTSIQGRYITLSSGKEQNIFEDDELNFYETKVVAEHPADGSWLAFERKALGKAKVIESKSNSSIAQITSLSYTDAIRVGDGALVDAIATRRSFQNQKSEDKFYTPVEPGSPIIEIQSRGQQKNLTPKVSVAEGARTKEPRLASNEKPKITTPAGAEETRIEPIPTEETTDSNSPAADSPEELSEVFPVKFEEIDLDIQNEEFDTSDAVSTKTAFPAWLINRADLSAHHKITPEIDGVLRAQVRLGSTSKGSYFGFGLSYEALYLIPLKNPALPSLEHLAIGGIGSFESLAVSDEKLGGWDILSLSPTIHARGSYHAVELAQNFDYDLAVSIPVLDLGEVGVSGKKRSVNEAQGFELSARIIRQMKAQEWEWGGMFAYQSLDRNLSKGKLAHTRIRFGLATRLRI